MRHISTVILFLAALIGQAAEPTRLACIGDSITQGYGVDAKDSYPTQLQALLGPTWKVENFGLSGTTLSAKGDWAYVTKGPWSKAKEFKPQVVVIMLGTNDAKPDEVGNAAELPRDLAAMVKELQQLDSKPRIILCVPCFVISPGNFSIDPSNLEKKIIPGILATAKTLNLQLLDLYTPTHAAATKNPGLIPDRVHPSAAGYGLIAEAVRTALQEEPTLKPKSKR